MGVFRMSVCLLAWISLSSVRRWLTFAAWATIAVSNASSPAFVSARKLNLLSSSRGIRRFAPNSSWAALCAGFRLESLWILVLVSMMEILLRWVSSTGVR